MEGGFRIELYLAPLPRDIDDFQVTESAVCKTKCYKADLVLRFLALSHYDHFCATLTRLYTAAILAIQTLDLYKIECGRRLSTFERGVHEQGANGNWAGRSKFH